MALFKIFKGAKTDLGKSTNGTNKTHEGYLYFTSDEGKFYIDVADSNTAVMGINRIALNADKADRADNFTIAGALNANGESYIDSASIGNLQVTGAANFTQIPTSPTPTTASNDTSIATTEFVKSAITTDNLNGIVPINQGGTSATSSAAARTNLGLGNAKIYYGTCDTAAGTAIKEVTCADFPSTLSVGMAIYVKFTNANSAAVADLQLKIGNNQYPIKKHYNSTMNNNLNAVGQIGASIHHFLFDGTNWILVDNDYNSDTNTILRVYTQDTGYNGNYPILVGRTAASTLTDKSNGDYTGVYGVIYKTNAPTLNPSTGAMTVPGGIIGNISGQASCANYATTAGYVSGIVPISNGGTGKTTALEALEALGGPDIIDKGHALASGENIDALNYGTYYSVDSTRTKTLTGTIPYSASGFKLFNINTYSSSTAYDAQIAIGAWDGIKYRFSSLYL